MALSWGDPPRDDEPRVPTILWFAVGLATAGFLACLIATTVRW